MVTRKWGPTPPIDKRKCLSHNRTWSRPKKVESFLERWAWVTLRPVCLGEAWGGPAEWQGHRNRTPNLCILQCLPPQHRSDAQAPKPGIILTSFSHSPHPIQWQTCWLHSLPLPLLAARPLLEHKSYPKTFAVAVPSA